MKTPQERAAIYALIARMVPQQQDVLRSMMAQDLVRMLKLGIYADPDERGLHLEAARRGIAADGVKEGAKHTFAPSVPSVLPPMSGLSGEAKT